MATPKKPDPVKRIADNKKATFNYFIEERFEAGMVLEGWEIKSLRDDVRRLQARGDTAVEPTMDVENVARAVVYMANQAGSNWKEPAAPAAAPAAAVEAVAAAE